MTLIPTMGGNISRAARRPDPEESMKHGIPRGNKYLQASKISPNMYHQKKSRMSEPQVEVGHLSRVS